MVEEEALAQVHRRDLTHFIFGELEVEYIEDFSNAVRAHGLGMATTSRWTHQRRTPEALQ
jgi:hypothetical protein